MYNREALEEMVRRHPECFPALKLLQNFHLFEGIHTAIGGKWIYGCGSYLFDGCTYNYNPRCLAKQEALYRYSMTASHVLEVGVYVGHSLLLMLLANPTLRITAIDCDDRFAKPAIDYLNRIFGNRITFILSDAVTALKTLPEKSFDMIHIDADHSDEAVTAQFNACLPLAKERALFVFDDYDAVRTTVDGLVSRGTLEHLITPDCLWRNTITRLAYRNSMDTIVRVAGKYSACGGDRLRLNIQAVREVNANGVPGSVVEIGIFTGGSMLAMMRAAEDGPVREFYLYDTYEGMTAPCEHDRDLNDYPASLLMERIPTIKCVSHLDEVRKNIETNTHTDPARIHYVVGDVTKTTVFPDSIAVLRLDTDFYESTAFELAQFYSRVSSGGYVIIDDYGHWKGCRKAVDEFLAVHPEITLVHIDYTGVFFVKPMNSSGV